MSDRAWRTWLAIGLVARLALAIFTSNSNDLVFYVQAADDGAQHTPMYQSASFSYPPLWGYFFALAGKALVALHVPLIVHARALDAFVVPNLNGSYLTTPLAALVLKLPAFAVDAALAELLYACALGAYGRGVARRLALAWWLNPLPLVVGGVQASWDAVVPFSMIFALVCARQGRYAFAGAALAAGVFAKLAPLYLIFLVPAFFREVGTPRGRAAALLAALGGAVAVALVVLWPILVWHEFGALKTAVFARGSTFALGGANLFAFAGLASAAHFNDWAVAHRSAIGLTLTLASLAGCCAIAELCRRRVPFTLDDAFAGAFGLITVLFLTSPFVQPTYIIWLLPFSLFLAVRNRVWSAISWALSALALAFYLTVRAVQSLLEPACLFFRLCDAERFGAASVKYAYSSGLGSSTLQVSLDVVLGELLCIVLLFAAAYCFDRLAIGSASTAVAAAPTVTTGVRRQAVAAAALVVVACGSAVAPGPAAVRVEVSVDGRRAVVRSHGYDGTVHVVVGDPGATCSELDAYDDERYPALRGVTPTFSAGLAIHLRSDLRLRGLRIPVRAIDAHGLALVLREPPGGRCLLLLGGALPDNVRDPSRDLLKPWLLAGGAVFWAGGPFDRVVTHRRSGDPTVAIVPFTIVPADWPDLVGNGGTTVFPETTNPFTPPVEHATGVAPAWAASRIAFDRTTFPLNAGPLQRRGGVPLAYFDRRYNSSVSALPLGRGRLVFFGDAFDDELSAAETIAQLLYTGVWQSPRYARVVNAEVRDGGAPIVIAGLRGGDRLRVFGERYGGGPFATADVSGRIDLRFAGHAALLASDGFAGGIVADVRARLPHDIGRLLVYRDDRYPAGRGAPPEFTAAVTAALRDDEEIAARGIAVSTLDARQLRAELVADPKGDAIVVFGGVLPATVRGAGYDLLKPWLERGGLAIWAGGPFDLLYARPGTGSYVAAHLDAPDYGPWPNLYGKHKLFPARVDPYRPPRRRADRPSAAWPMWRGAFRGTTFALDAGPLVAGGGTALGFVDDRANSSVSTFPVGRGRVVFFGDSFDDAFGAADDIARLMLTGAWDGSYLTVRTARAYFASAGARVTLTPIPPGSDVIVFGEQHDDVAPLIRNAPEN